MHIKKHYPDEDKVRQQGHQACGAIRQLVAAGVEIVNVSFLNRHPEITVNDCPGLAKIRSHFTGQGENEHGRYTRKTSIINDCTVRWIEVRE